MFGEIQALVAQPAAAMRKQHQRIRAIRHVRRGVGQRPPTQEKQPHLVAGHLFKPIRIQGGIPERDVQRGFAARHALLTGNHDLARANGKGAALRVLRRVRALGGGSQAVEG